ncbi:MAG: FAD:protein FMN transferase [Planctomycetota bacterium]
MSSAAQPPESNLLVFRGQTMGTTYMAKVAPPHDLPDDFAAEIDAELRRVNDQMSTYLKSSEITRFNQSTSTDWFSVSPDTAKVVGFAQRVSESTNGAFDITVGPLVDAWSFGPGKRKRTIPDDALLTGLWSRMGYEKLSVRQTPPGLRKSVPDLRIDLSAIAKGHGVDRVVDLLDRFGAQHVFVEIGGEVRTKGSKAGQPWRVGIQSPDAAAQQLAIAHTMADQAIATSGDYRNYFTIDGVRYSHTIDPNTGRPVVHDVASVSVIAEDCMTADAWATAINVLGHPRGIEVASENQLSVLTFRRVHEDFLAEETG